MLNLLSNEPTIIYLNESATKDFDKLGRRARKSNSPDN